MQVNKVSAVAFTGIKNTQKAEKKQTQAVSTNPMQKVPMPSAQLMQVMSGVKVSRPEPTKYTPETAEKFLENHPANKVLKGEDRDNVKKVMCSGTKEAANVQMQLSLIADGDLEPSTVKCYWATGKMNKNLAKDIDMVYEAKKAGKNVNDVYVPTVKSKSEGHKSAKVGDVFKVDKEDKIYVKANDKESRQLNMDKDMFVKLFPPAKRFTTQQRSIGDCYLVSTLGTLMNNPKARVAVYEAFNQDGKDVTVKFKNGFGEYKYKDAELPKDRVEKYSLAGSTGIRLLEDAYGLDSVNKADTMFKKIMNERIDAKEKELAKAPMAKKPELMESIKGHKQRLADYNKAKADPNRTIVVCRDDNYYNIFYEEDKNGLVFTDLKKDPDNKEDKFQRAADFYRGSLGGYNFEVLQRFGFGGFRQWNLNFEADKVKDMMMKPNFNEDYIMTGGTRASGGRTENPVAEAAGVYGFHAYTLEPQVGKNGELKVRCTNPWNTSYNADIDYDKFLEYYDSASVCDVNSYGKNLPLEEQPVKYGKKGPIAPDSKEEPVTWYITNKKPVDVKKVNMKNVKTVAETKEANEAKNVKVAENKNAKAETKKA